jgi:hypothetical protein
MKDKVISALSRFLGYFIITFIIQSIYSIGKLEDLFSVDPTFIQWLAMVCILSLAISPFTLKHE